MAREITKRADLIAQVKAKKSISDLPGWSGWTPQQMETYIDNNVTDLVSIKKLLKNMAKMIVLLRNGVIGE